MSALSTCGCLPAARGTHWVLLGSLCGWRLVLVGGVGFVGWCWFDWLVGGVDCPWLVLVGVVWWLAGLWGLAGVGFVGLRVVVDGFAGGVDVSSFPGCTYTLAVLFSQHE